MMTFVDRILQSIREKHSHAVVGIDPVWEKLPPEFRKGRGQRTLDEKADGVLQFCTGLIDAVSDLVPAIKPQSAFFEQYGVPGITALGETIRHAKSRGLLVILDAKRGDIGSTAAAYSSAYLSPGGFNVDAITVNPYLGSDGLKPFIRDCMEHGKGVFVLVKTSNPSSIELQDLEVVGENGRGPLFARVASLVAHLSGEVMGENEYSSVGAVVGATFPENARRLRAAMPRSLFLVPGYGAQGARGQDIVDLFNPDGLGALISASRSVNYAFSLPQYVSLDFGTAARLAVEEMNKDIEAGLRTAGVWLDD